MTTTPVLELKDIRAAYGRIDVLHGVDLVVPPRSVVALLGPNGAGKTTVLRVASGQHRPTSGCLHVMGKHVNGADPDALSRAGVCTIPEGRGIFANLTVEENLQMMTYSGARFDHVRERAFVTFPRLQERRKQLAGTMSGGEQQMLAMARALATDCALLLLDEISMGLAPIIVDELYESVKRIASEGVAILLTEQYAQTALRVADYAAIMTQGKVRSMGEPADVADELSGVYLGSGK
ncbi:MAG TPA: ABC transporter ATP-binding protein [Actinomycetota bacterium]|jgi:branched-chain amino acid transport system ATP-binding protein|nr:ABC transporter ATP-binding protein [Actinomycetota bacterium]